MLLKNIKFFLVLLATIFYKHSATYMYLLLEVMTEG